jgi:hypothetical protein
MGDCLLRAVFLITEVVHISVLLISPPSLKYVLILTKNGLGYSLGDFFTYSSGHPAEADF